MWRGPHNTGAQTGATRPPPHGVVGRPRKPVTCCRTCCGHPATPVQLGANVGCEGVSSGAQWSRGRTCRPTPYSERFVDQAAERVARGDAMQTAVWLAQGAEAGNNGNRTHARKAWSASLTRGAERGCEGARAFTCTGWEGSCCSTA